MPHNTGMGWIRLHKRMAIYYRDHFDCVWCRGVFPIDTLGYGLTLDHLEGSSNEVINLVTCCHWCNTSRHDATLDEWIERLVERGHYASTVRKRLKRQISKPLITREGSIWLARQRRPKYKPV